MSIPDSHENPSNSSDESFAVLSCTFPDVLSPLRLADAERNFKSQDALLLLCYSTEIARQDYG